MITSKSHVPVAAEIIRQHAITTLRQFIQTPDDLVTMKLATQAIKAMSALLLEDVSVVDNAYEG